MNRERTFWIYKHQLFHRDHPEDMHLLRRRTCPGFDGRKNRLIYTRKASTCEADDRSQDSDEPTGQGKASDEEASTDDEESVAEKKAKSRKKRSVSSKGRASNAKRSRRDNAELIEEKKTDESDDDVSSGKRSNYMTSRFSPRPKHRSAWDDKDSDDDSSSEKETDKRAERRSRAIVVSQVAIKLDEYARMAKRGMGRTRSGYVTPPVGGGMLPSGHYYRSVITYDDEYEAMSLVHSRRRGSGIFSSASIVTDMDESTHGDDQSTAGLVSEASTPMKPARLGEQLFDKAPVEDHEIVKAIQQRIMSKGTADSYEAMLASSALVGFCMKTSPLVSGDLCTKVLQLTASCEQLAIEFQQYRNALHPGRQSHLYKLPAEITPSNHGFNDETTLVSARDIWERAGSRRDAARDFKTLAINHMQNLLKHHGEFDFTKDEVASLRLTENMWSMSTRPF